MPTEQEVAVVPEVMFTQPVLQQSPPRPRNRLKPSPSRKRYLQAENRYDHLISNLSPVVQCYIKRLIILGLGYALRSPVKTVFTRAQEITRFIKRINHEFPYNADWAPLIANLRVFRVSQQSLPLESSSKFVTVDHGHKTGFFNGRFARYCLKSLFKCDCC